MEGSLEGSQSKRVRVGVDDGERVENGRNTIQGLSEKKNGSVVCVMNSHAPTRVQDPEDRSNTSNEGVERLVPRKTSVESDHRRGTDKEKQYGQPV